MAPNSSDMQILPRGDIKVAVHATVYLLISLTLQLPNGIAKIMFTNRFSQLSPIRHQSAKQEMFKSCKCVMHLYIYI